MRFIISLFLIFLIGLVYYFFSPELSDVMFFAKEGLSSLHPSIRKGFDYVDVQKNSVSVKGISIYSTLLSTSFISRSLENYIRELLSKKVSKLKIIFLLSIFTTLGSFINYLIGYFAGEKIINYFFGGIGGGFRKQIFDHSAWLIVFASSILPLPDFTSMAIGSHKFSAKKFIIITFIGKFFHVLSMVYNPELILQLASV